MFEYRRGRTRAEVAALFGQGIELVDRSYVEDTETGNLLTTAGGYAHGRPAGGYLLRWRGRPIGLRYDVERRDDEHGHHPLLTLSEVGSSAVARMHTRVAHVDLTPEDAMKALRVAIEACVVIESFRDRWGQGARVADPVYPGRELAPVDFGYDEIEPLPWGER